MSNTSEKILIIGAKGMLGRELAGVSGDADPVLWDREEIDITSETDVKMKIHELKPAIIINAAAYTNVDACETESDAAFAVNGEGVWFLAKAARACGATLVHYSTDYVFDGKKEEGYNEDDEPKNSVNEYGLSKLLGERLLQEEGKLGLSYYLIRTSWLFGIHGKNFVQTMLDAGKTQVELKVVNDQHGKPTYARDLAKATRELIQKSYPSGVYHLVNEPRTTWFDFSKAIFYTHAKFYPDFKNPTMTPCDSSVYPRPAKRPQYSVLLNTKFPALREWQEALQDYLVSVGKIG